MTNNRKTNKAKSIILCLAAACAIGAALQANTWNSGPDFNFTERNVQCRPGPNPIPYHIDRRVLPRPNPFDRDKFNPRPQPHPTPRPMPGPKPGPMPFGPHHGFRR